MQWTKCKRTTGKVRLSPQFLAKEKFTFQRAIYVAILEHIIPSLLVINLDQTPLSFLFFLGKYTFSFKGAKNFPIRGVNDKRQISGTFMVTLNGKFLTIQLIYKGKLSSLCENLDFSILFQSLLLKLIGQTLRNQLSFLRKSFFSAP